MANNSTTILLRHHAALQPSRLIERASPRISSILSSFGEAGQGGSGTDSRSGDGVTSHGNDTNDHVLSPYFRPSSEAVSSNTEPSSTNTTRPLISKQELQEWETPHMPLMTSKQLELTLVEIRRRERHRLKQANGNNDNSDETQQRQQQIIQQITEQKTKRKRREAAILVPLCTVQGVPSLIFTRRSAKLSTHASQISFPGGYYDEGLDDNAETLSQNNGGAELNVDYRLANAALREMQEELCFEMEDFGTSRYFEYFSAEADSDFFKNRQQQTAQQSMQLGNGNTKDNSTTIQNQIPLITILGQTQPVPQMAGNKVTPIIATLNYDLPSPSSLSFHKLFPGNPDEVDWIFTISIQELLEKETSEPLRRWSKVDTANYKGRHEVWGPVFPVPDYEIENYLDEMDGSAGEGERTTVLRRMKKEGDKVWGLTASVLRPLLHKILLPVFGEEGLGVVTKKRTGCDGGNDTKSKL